MTASRLKVDQVGQVKPEKVWEVVRTDQGECRHADMCVCLKSSFDEPLTFVGIMAMIKGLRRGGAKP